MPVRRMWLVVITVTTAAIIASPPRLPPFLPYLTIITVAIIIITNITTVAIVTISRVATKLELSQHLLTSEARLRNTLAHEMCHVAGGGGAEQCGHICPRVVCMPSARARGVPRGEWGCAAGAGAAGGGSRVAAPLGQATRLRVCIHTVREHGERGSQQ